MGLLNQPQPMRNIQLDFFRGLALMVIFINHMPDNPWFWFTPSQYGLSDAADVFVFLSGFASALAYGRCFERAGLGLGLIRILHRCVQIYSAHLTSFVLLALICVIGNRWVPEMDDIQRLNIAYFFDSTQQALYDLFTLAYVPNYFDILPMYLVMMAWLPIFWVLSRLHVVAALSCSLGLYWATWQYGWEFTADPATGRPWYFNPMCWQLMFFTGFAFGAGWLKVKVQCRWLTVLCLTLVLSSIPLGHEATYAQIPFWGELRAKLEPWMNKSHLGVLRWVHLLAVAYLMRQLCHWRPEWLNGALPRAIITLGQQSLPIFLCSMVLSYAGGIVLDRLGRELTDAVALVNLSGLALLMIVGQIMAWLDTKPWKFSPAEGLTLRAIPVDLEQSGIAYRWSRQALALPFLIGLAALPAALSHQQRFAPMAPDVVVQTTMTDAEAIQPVEIHSEETDADKLIDSRQQL
ncbi:OpgC family protein [Methylomonas rosea]|uniref:OpgC domain-containing protein n=1 Tax=Methylomonas rosea TaxID=2952227 RepID=A0ABT1TNW0_9GAMM|nr:OpgC domain-containing protein [Methylomonas sp. WSC-7]MCQ8116465.1 OpgC domain-containing protein [Methylomonas sp. WSC-7]